MYPVKSWACTTTLKQTSSITNPYSLVPKRRPGNEAKHWVVLQHQASYPISRCMLGLLPIIVSSPGVGLFQWKVSDWALYFQTCDLMCTYYYPSMWYLLLAQARPRMPRIYTSIQNYRWAAGACMHTEGIMQLDVVLWDAHGMQHLERVWTTSDALIVNYLFLRHSLVQVASGN